MPMGEYYNLFLGVGVAVLLFLAVQHIGHARAPARSRRSGSGEKGCRTRTRRCRF